MLVLEDTFRVFPLTLDHVTRLMSARPCEMHLERYEVLRAGEVSVFVEALALGHGQEPQLGEYWGCSFTHPEIEACLKGHLETGERVFVLTLEGGEIVARPKDGAVWSPDLGTEQRFQPCEGRTTVLDFAQPFRDREFVEWVARQGIISESMTAGQPEPGSPVYRFRLVTELAAGIVVVTHPSNDPPVTVMMEDAGVYQVFLRRDLVARCGVASVIDDGDSEPGVRLRKEWRCSEIHLDEGDGEMHRRILAELGVRESPYEDHEVPEGDGRRKLQLSARDYVWQREPSLWKRRLAETL